MQRCDSAPGLAKAVTPSGSRSINLDSNRGDLVFDSILSAIMHAAVGERRMPTGNRKS